MSVHGAMVWREIGQEAIGQTCVEGLDKLKTTKAIGLAARSALIRNDYLAAEIILTAVELYASRSTCSCKDELLSLTSQLGGALDKVCVLDNVANDKIVEAICA